MKQRPYAQKINVDKFKELFYEKQWSNKEIAKFFGVGESAIGSVRRRNNLPSRGHANGVVWNKGKKGLQKAWNKGKKVLQVTKENNPNWKGGRYITPYGYVMVRIDGNFSNYRGYALEHRYIMEQHIGRKLRTEETVHHINGDKLDNRLKNLKLLDNKSHSKLHYPKGSKFGINSGIRG